MAQPRETKAEPHPEVRVPSPVETMIKEREYCPFDKRQLTYALHGGKTNVVLKEKFMKEIERDPAFRLDDIHDLSKDAFRERTMAKFHSMVHFVTTERLDVFSKRMELVGIADPSFWTRFGVHYGLFLGAIRSGATSNQFNYWLEKGVLGLNGMIGCFAMTELAHGSNVAGLETTATFDEKTDEFVIHTPTISATKWWIGGAASTATHCACFAQMWVLGKCYGTKTFIVPLRDPRTFQTLPGITIGDIGKKMGRDGIDNGYIQFTYVRVPRSYMLQKHTQVTRKGQVYEPALTQLTYGALLQGRVAMVADAANVSKKALTIALRYGAVRRQFKTGDNALETQIIDYPLHQRRLIPLLSQAVALGFTALQMTALYEDLMEKLETFDASSDAKTSSEVLEKLKETHATSAGLKAFSTWSALDCIEKCRQTCGGHGYSAYVNLSSMYADQAVQVSWEGDNGVLTLQSGRSLIGSYLEAKKGKKVADGVAYLNRLDSVVKMRCPSDDRTTDLDVIDQAWACVAANCVQKAADTFLTHARAGKNKELAHELCSQERFVASKVHSTGYIYRNFRSGVEELAKKEDPNNGVVDILILVCQLYGCWAIEENAAFFLKYHFYTSEQMDLVSNKVTELCAELRKSVVSIVDAFCFSDHIINSPLGCASGDVYNKYFNLVRAANPPAKEHPYFERLIRPLLERTSLDVDDSAAMDLDEEIDEMVAERAEQQQQKNGKGPIGLGEEELKTEAD